MTRGLAFVRKPHPIASLGTTSLRGPIRGPTGGPQLAIRTFLRFTAAI